MRRNLSFALAVILALSVCGMLGACGARGQETTPSREVPRETQSSATEAIQNSLGMVLVPIPAGEFLMGSPEKQEKELNLFAPGTVWWKLIEGPQHKVKITKSFHMGATEVTQGQWKAVMGNNPSSNQGDDNLPVEQVGWDDCQVFLRKLSEEEGKTYRLPTEAEWEYACRAGSTAKFCFGDDEQKLDEYAWHAKVSPRDFKTHPVGLKKANAWGLYDMHGNVWEWCQDRYSKEYEDKEQVDPTGPVKDWGDRVMRGGARFYNKPTSCSSTCRNAYEGDYRIDGVGFRVM